MLDARVAEDLRRRHDALLAQGALPALEQLRHYYVAFSERFGPDALLRLTGVELLHRLHLHGNQDSLVYWLEFKNDEQFPDWFGGIGGGSALKFGLYRSRESGIWMTGSPQQQHALSEEEAVLIATQHRDQFVAGANILRTFSERPGEPDYESLQDQMEAEAPNVQDSAWGHKYFSLLFPDLLDDYHAVEWQRFHLIKLLRTPPTKPGRYVCAGEFRSIAGELGIPINHLTTTLRERSGAPHSYWRIGTSQDGEARSEWPAMRDGSFVAIGWASTGDLSAVSHDAAGKEQLRTRIQASAPSDRQPQQVGRDTNQIFAFLSRVRPGSMVMASDGATVLGLGVVEGDYQFAAGERMAHRRRVRWLDVGEWPMPDPEGLRTTVQAMTKVANLIEAERRLLGPVLSAGPRLQPAGLTGKLGQIESALRRKGQLILYGPPGTGKTFWADLTVKELAARSWFNRDFGQLSDDERHSLLGEDRMPGAVEFCTFHPAYGYEDFIEGFRPGLEGGQLAFSRQSGVFKRLCERAKEQIDRDFFLVIDEINRGDIPRIFGELITLLEKDKRGKEILLPLSMQKFSVPPNVFLIGTMNTADRSIALLDTALRRRFAFIELMPDVSILHSSVQGIPLGRWLDALNARIRAHVGRDGRNLQIGHSYLLVQGRPVSDLREFSAALQQDILPLLEEYCYDDYAALEQILGNRFVLRSAQSFDQDLFLPQNEDNLLHALQQLFPEILMTQEAVRADAEEEVAPDDEPDSAG